MYYIRNTEVPHLAARLSKTGHVYVPSGGENRYNLIRYHPSGDNNNPAVFFNEFRTEFPSLKTTLFSPRCTVAKLPQNDGNGNSPPDKIYLFGIKACDLRARKVLNKVFMEGEYIDPFYKNRLENTIIISGDCISAKDTCFCTLLDGEPFPKDGFDLNFSPSGDGFLVETGSPKGENIVRDNEGMFEPADDDRIRERDRRRMELTQAIIKNNELLSTSPERRLQAIERNLNLHAIWDKSSATCVACNACNYVCPTCYCFLLFDRKTEGGSERIRAWDSCFHSGYARMAGGLTPRLRLVERFKNHYYHKFDSYVANFGFEACSGCGRCINACSGQIDKRKILKEIERYIELQ